MDVLNACLRHGLLQTYERCVLEDFRLAGMEVTRTEKARKGLPAVPASGTLDLAGVLASTYFFG